MDSSYFDDQIEKANILIAEDLFEDAKKLLRKTLIQFPDEIRIKKKLEEIQNKEISQLMVENLDPELTNTFIKISNETNANTKKLILDLKISEIKSNDKIKIFKSPEELEKYKIYIYEIIKNLNIKEKIDLGIAYLVMELPEISVAIFKTLNIYVSHEKEILYLNALAHILNQQHSEAVLLLEPLLINKEIEDKIKIDFNYLAGIAYENLNDRIKAKEKFHQVYLVDPKYIDIAVKIK